MSYPTEPWLAGIPSESPNERIIGADYLSFCRVFGSPHHSVEETARRIVACVNACKGIPTDTLESGVVAKLFAIQQ